MRDRRRLAHLFQLLQRVYRARNRLMRGQACYRLADGAGQKIVWHQIVRRIPEARRLPDIVVGRYGINKLFHLRQSRKVIHLRAKRVVGDDGLLFLFLIGGKYLKIKTKHRLILAQLCRLTACSWMFSTEGRGWHSTFLNFGGRVSVSLFLTSYDFGNRIP